MTEERFPLWGDKVLQVDSTDDSALTKVNVNRLTNIISKSLEGMTDSNLFDFNEKTQAKTIISDYLNVIKERKGIYDHDCHVKEATWEDFYPTMPLRLYVIQAFEEGRAVSNIYEDTLPEKYSDLPYRMCIDYFIEGVDEEGHTYRDYYSDSYPPPETCLKKGEKIVEKIHWNLPNPEGMLIADIKYTPIKPIKYITLNTVITKTDANFSESGLR